MNRIAVVVTTYNRPDALERVLSAYLSQAHQGIELQVADDGSTSDTRRVVERFAARDPADGHPTQDPKYFREFAPDIKRRSNVVLNFTTGGAATMTIEERLQPALQLKPEVASLNMGSMNFGLYPMLKRFTEFKHDWERPYLEGSHDRIFKNTFTDIANILTTCAKNGTSADFADRGRMIACR